MGQITATRNLVATKVVRHAGQKHGYRILRAIRSGTKCEHVHTYNVIDYTVYYRIGAHFS